VTDELLREGAHRTFSRRGLAGGSAVENAPLENDGANSWDGKGPGDEPRQLFAQSFFQASCSLRHFAALHFPLPDDELYIIASYRQHTSLTLCADR